MSMSARFYLSSYGIKIILKSHFWLKSYNFVIMYATLLWTSTFPDNLLTTSGLLILFKALFHSQMQRHIINKDSDTHVKGQHFQNPEL